MVSVIIPVYNTEAYLDECIRSVVNQSYDELEILLINDGSTDRSGTICRKWETLDRRIRYIEKENEGQGYTRNLGIALATGEYIIFVDSDDYLDTTLVDRVYRCITENKADICVFAHYGIDDEGLLDECLLSFKLAKGDYTASNKDLLSHMMPVLWDKMFSAALIKNMDIKMSNHICEDLVFNARLYVRAKKICMLDVPLYYYRYKRPGNISTSYSRYLEVEKSIHELNVIFEKENMFKEYWMQLYDIAVTMFKDILLRIKKRTDLDVPVEIKSRYPEYLTVYKNCLSRWFSEYLDINLQDKNYILVGSYNLRILLHRFLLEEDFLREDYGYSSIVSLMSDMAFGQELFNDCQFKNAYRKKCVEQDIEKSFSNHARLKEADYIIIDFLDEIWDLIKIRNECYITDSPFLREAEVLKSQSYDKIPFLCEERRALFKKYIRDFIERAKQSGISVVVVKNFLCEKHGKYYDVFTDYEGLQKIREINQELEWYYQYFITCFPDVIVVDSSEFSELIFTQEEFPFGCQPFYYNEGYYQRMAIQINRCINARVKNIEKDV